MDDEIASDAQSSSSAKLGLLPPNLTTAAATTKPSELNMPRAASGRTWKRLDRGEHAEDEDEHERGQSRLEPSVQHEL